jgi:phosphoglycolate phosphatase-like HAD superfamily hydrolase
MRLLSLAILQLSSVKAFLLPSILQAAAASRASFATMAAKDQTPVVALDFDGVLCNSVGESSRSAFLCLQKRYPEVLAGTDWENLDDADAPAWLVDKMRKLRPVVETGYENILLTRLLLDEYKAARLNENTTGYRPLTLGEIAANWSDNLKETLMRRYGATKDELVEAFGTTRDEWMARDAESWLEANTFYERLGVLDAAKDCTANMYIITTKQHRFATALIKHAGLSVPDEKVRHALHLFITPRSYQLMHQCASITVSVFNRVGIMFQTVSHLVLTKYPLCCFGVPAGVWSGYRTKD